MFGKNELTHSKCDSKKNTRFEDQLTKQKIGSSYLVTNQI